MIKYLAHSEIDKVMWNLCVEQSVNRLIYANSWYLDIVSPGWEALVLNDYDAVFPLTPGKKIYHYLYQPFFTQQLGMFCRFHKDAVKLESFLEAIPSKYRFVDIQLNESNHPDPGKWKLKKRKNFLLDLDYSYQKIEKKFSNQARRNIKKAGKNKLQIKPLEPGIAVDFYVKYHGNRTTELTAADYKRLKELLYEADAQRAMNCLGVFDQDDDLITSCILLSDKGRLTIINNCASPKGRELRGMYLLLDDIILKNAGQALILDFEGSDIQGIAQFNKGFGASRHTYYRLKINRLPWYIKWLKS